MFRNTELIRILNQIENVENYINELICNNHEVNKVIQMYSQSLILVANFTLI